SVTITAAPRAIASGTNRGEACLKPGTATKQSPGATFRESAAIPPIAAGGAPIIRVSPSAATTSLTGIDLLAMSLLDAPHRRDRRPSHRSRRTRRTTTISPLGSPPERDSPRTATVSWIGLAALKCTRGRRQHEPRSDAGSQGRAGERCLLHHAAVAAHFD